MGNEPRVSADKILSNAKVVFWDFDGVIKDSVEVKADAFVQLFQSYGVEIADRVREHHEANGGMSRFEKLPLYLEWAGDLVTPGKIEDCCGRFSQLVFQGVVDAPWVPGAEALLRGNPHRQEFILTTATPQVEIEEILASINLRGCFSEVFGAPLSKKEAIRRSLAARKMDALDCLMIGDAKADYDAAMANKVPFLLRRHALNRRVFANYIGDALDDFVSYEPT
jgi:phosphoglycolate phosphatase-like HAD superfamily hydrolase